MLVFKRGSAQFEVKTLDRCIFCFCKLIDEFDGTVDDSVVPKYTRKSRNKKNVPPPDFPVTEFQQVWTHFVPQNERNRVQFVSSAPPLCGICGFVLEKIPVALKQIADATTTIRTRMKFLGGNDETNKEQKMASFWNDLKAGVAETKVLWETLKLLEELGHGSLGEFLEEIDDKPDANELVVPQDEIDVEVKKELGTHPELNEETPSREREEIVEEDSKRVVEEEPIIEFSQKPFGVDPLSEETLNDIDNEELVFNRPALRPITKTYSKKTPVTILPPTDDVKPKEKRIQLSCDFCRKRVTGNMMEHMKSHVGDYAIQCRNPECQFVFSNLTKYGSHLKLSPDCYEFKTRKVAKCDLCGVQNCGVSGLGAHYRRVHETAEKNYPCPLAGCSRSFTFRQAVYCHIASKVNGLKYKPKPKPRKEITHQHCDFCRLKVPFSEILEHIRGHVGDFALPCPNPSCRHVYTQLLRLKTHLSTRSKCASFTTADVYACEVCGDQAENIRMLRGHLDVVHETGEKPYQCPVTGCSHSFTFRQTVHCHIFTHINSGKGKLALPSFQACPECDTHLHQDEIQGHLISAHGVTPESIISCKYCPYLFHARRKLVDHLEHHFKSGVEVSCDLCQECGLFTSMTSVRDHYWREHHVGNTKFVCRICNRCFTSDGELKNHNKQSHSRLGRVKKVSTKVYTCNLPGCGKTFQSYGRLNFHRRSVEHVGNTNSFVCDQCGKGFNHKVNLREHEKSHSNVRSVVCEDCGESFKSGEILKKHKLIHTGERPFQCEICSQRFRYKVVLTRHLRAHQEKGSNFKPNGPMKNIRKRINRN